MLETSTIVALVIAAVVGAAGGVFLLLSGSRGMVFMDKLYGPPWPGKLRPKKDRR
jgi:hypothetical protein